MILGNQKKLRMHLKFSGSQYFMKAKSQEAGKPWITVDGRQILPYSHYLKD
jgi:hypothetical protein